MANGATNPSRLGQANAAGDVLALFLKKFAGEVLTTFATENVFQALHTVRTIENGKSAQFPVTGVATAAYHTPGDNIADSGNSYLSNIKHGEKVINIDSMLVASSFVANIDELQNHYDVRSIYSTELGRALAMQYDKTVSQVIALGGTSPIGGDGGSNLTCENSAGTEPSASELVDQIYIAAQTLDEKNVPAEDRYCVVRPEEYYKIAQSSTTLFDRDYGTTSGVYEKANLPRIANIQMVMSNNTPRSVLSEDTATNNTYHGDFSDLRALVFQKQAAGTVKLLDLAVESEYQIERQGTLMVAKYVCGHGVLRPEAVVAINQTS